MTKKNVTVLVAASADGRMKKCMVIFKGQGQSTEDKLLVKRSDIEVCYSDNGWANDEIIAIWLKWIFPAFDLSKKLLVWDSFRAHISENTKKVIKSMKNLYTAVIPGGCTSLIQPCDVGINWVGFNSRWGSIVSIFVFDWGSINIFMGWGCNQDWGFG